MKLGLLGSTETHRGTRWAPKWAFAAREAQVGEFEFSEIHRARRGHPPYARLGAAVKNISDPLEATPFCSRIIQAPMKLKKVVYAPILHF
ncbi:hypothetical protein E3N88_41717 [Mikania micrantha]|uniref:Uncharacterized protein n=1 Tax=Mikania micrantha TaxID=192012 RepID=A0A5N6LJU5_9ASTR|nr:hypothetical protein E3N88_41717 [Mikania micrantha]